MEGKDGKKKESIDEILSDLNGLLNKMPSILDGIKMPDLPPAEFNAAPAPRKEEPSVPPSVPPAGEDKTIIIEPLAALPEGAAAPEAQQPLAAVPPADADKTVVIEPLSSLPEGAPAPDAGEKLVPQSLGDFMFGEESAQPAPEVQPAAQPEIGTEAPAGSASLPPQLETTKDFGIPDIDALMKLSEEEAEAATVPVQDQAQSAQAAQEPQDEPQPVQPAEQQPAQPEAAAPEAPSDTQPSMDELAEFERQLTSAAEESPAQEALPAEVLPAAGIPVIEPEPALPAMAEARQEPAQEPAPAADAAIPDPFAGQPFEQELQAQPAPELQPAAEAQPEPAAEIQPAVMPEAAPAQEAPAAEVPAPAEIQPAPGIQPSSAPVSAFEATLPIIEPEGAQQAEQPAPGIELSPAPALGDAQAQTMPATEPAPSIAGGIELSPSVSLGSAPAAQPEPAVQPEPAQPADAAAAQGLVIETSASVFSQQAPAAEETLVVAAPAGAAPEEEKTVIYQPSSPGMTSSTQAGDLAGLADRQVPEGIPADRVRQAVFMYSAEDKALCASVLAELDAICLKSASKPMFIKRVSVRECEPDVNANFVLQSVTDTGAHGLVCLGAVPQEKIYELENAFGSAGAMFRHYDSASFGHSAALDLVIDLILR